MDVEEIQKVITDYAVEAAYGAAVLKAYQLENSLVLLLTTKLIDEFGDESSDFQKAQEKVKRLTMGRLIDRVLKEFELSDYWGDELDNMLYFRNELVHNISWEIQSSRVEPNGKERLVEYLSEIQSYFVETNTEIMRLVFQWFEEHGISKEKLYKIAAKWVEIATESRNT